MAAELQAGYKVRNVAFFLGGSARCDIARLARRVAYPVEKDAA